MFGMGFMEIFLVLVVAIIALGPEKLPSAMVDIAKFFRKFKSGIEDAKSTLDNELNISEMKKEAEKFKASVAEVKSIASVDVPDLTSLDIMDDNLSNNKPIKKEKVAKVQKQQYQDTSTQTIKKETIPLNNENEEVQA